MDGKVTCRRFQFIIVQDGWNREEKTKKKYFIGLYDQIYVTSLQTFSDVRLCTVVRGILSVFSFRPYVCKCYGGKCRHSSSYCPRKFDKAVGNGGI